MDVHTYTHTHTHTHRGAAGEEYSADEGQNTLKIHKLPHETSCISSVAEGGVLISRTAEA